MSIIILILSAVVFATMPWLIGTVVRRVIKQNDKNTTQLPFLIEYCLSLSAGYVFLSYIYITCRYFNQVLGTTLLIDNFAAVVIASTLLVVSYNTKAIKNVCLNDCSTIKVFGVLFIFIGILAMLAHPYVYDSGQLMSLLSITDKWNEFDDGYDRGMLGYSALLLSVATLFTEYPLPFIASALKPTMFIVTAASFISLSLYFERLNKLVLLALVSVIFFSSTMALYGHINLGKDSILGLAFLWLFFNLWLLKDKGYDLSDSDLAFLLLSASLIGIISIPYALAFFVVLTVLEPTSGALWSFYKKFLFIGALPLSYLLKSVLLLDSNLTVFLLILVAAVIALCIEIFVKDKKLNNQIIVNVVRYLPLFLLILLFLLIPSYNSSIDANFNWQWSSLRPPLDDKTTFFGSLTSTLHTETNMSLVVFIVGWLGIVFWSINSRKSTELAFTSMPFVVLLFCAIHVNMDLHVLRYRLLWDLYKDIPQWLSGFYVGAGIVFITDYIYSGKIKSHYKIVFPLLILILAVLNPFRENYKTLYGELTPMAMFSSVAGHNNSLMLSIIDYNYMNSNTSVVLLEKGIVWPGPRSFSVSYGYDVSFWNRRKIQKIKILESYSNALICYHRSHEQSAHELMKVNGYKSINKEVIQSGQQACDVFNR